MAENVRDDTYVPPSFLPALGPNYLGDPETVDRLVGEFCASVVAALRARSEGGMAVVCTAELRALGAKYATIFTGHDPAYHVIEGYNRVTLAFRARAELKEFWQAERANFDDDPVQVLFAWLAYWLFASLKDEDEVLADLRMRDRIRQMREILMGTGRTR